MRDLLLLVFSVGSLPFILTSTWLGLMLWVWHGLMNPARLTWSYAYDFPFSQLVALVTLASLLFNKEEKRFPWTSTTRLLTLFVAWMTLTTFFALEPDYAWPKWVWLFKVMLMTYLILWFMNSKERIQQLVWVIALSLGFYALKLGVFTLVTGGHYMAGGPEGTLIAGNNAMGVALPMLIPLLFYLYSQATQKWLRMSLLGTAVLGMAGTVGTQSRGALLALAAMSSFLLLKKRTHRFTLVLIFAASVPAIISFLPESWFARMDTIATYEEDASAMGRITAWSVAFHLANDRLLGGGFEPISSALYAKYAPLAPVPLDTHSIYFQVLAQHGYIGLLLFLSIGISAFLAARRTQSLATNIPDLHWAAELARMLQVGMLAYAVGGAFVNLAYLDLYYYYIALITCTLVVVNKELGSEPVRAADMDAPRQGMRAGAL